MEKEKKKAKENISENKESKASNKQEESKKKDQTTEETGFWDDAIENVSEGAKIVGDEAREFGKKIASYSEVLFGKIKDNTQEAFKYGLDLTQDGVHRAQELAERLRDDFEIRKQNNLKKDVAAQLGINFYLEIKNNDNKVPDNLMKKKNIISLLKELEKIDKEILKHSSEEKD